MAAMSESTLETTTVSSDDTVICGCANLTVAELHSFASGGNSFDYLLAKTGAGGGCTSCLLDLEYHFERTAVSKPRRRAREAGADAARGLKRRVYDWLDRHSPLVPFVRTQFGPVLHGPGIEQWILIANHKLLYKDEFVPPAAKVATTVRDSEGRALAEASQHVQVGETLRINLTDLSRKARLDEATDEAVNSGLSAGTFELRCQWLTPGMRGTARPQILIAAQGGTTAVHTVGPSRNLERWIACVNRPDSERAFISVVNPSKRELTARVSYPFSVEGCDPVAHEVVLPPMGARLHEVTLRPELAAVVGSQPFNVLISCRGQKNVHVVLASPGLDRLSIDHL